MPIITPLEAEELYAKLQLFEFTESNAELTFLDRLADENAWDRLYAERVLEEYRRFIVLAMFAGHTVSPSDQIDQVWHLHMLYSHSYWDELCDKLLGKPLHHQPTLGGIEEQVKYLELYECTLESYQRIFGEPPSTAIWPEPAVRFSNEKHFQRIDVKAKNSSYWQLATVVGVFAGVSFFSGSWSLAAFAGVLAILITSGDSASASVGGGSDGAGGDGSGCGSGCGGGCGG